MIARFQGHCPCRIGFPFGSLAAALLGFSLLIQSHVSIADATPYPSRIIDWCLRNNIVDITFGCGFDSPTSACKSLEDPIVVFNSFTLLVGHAVGACLYNHHAYPGAPIVYTGFGWYRRTYCYKGGFEESFISEAPICSCPAGQMFPPVFPNGNLSVCVPDTCPVDDLLPFPPAGDACSASLEAGLGKDVNNACPASSVMNDPDGEPCLAQKLSSLRIPYAGPTATIRTPAYQAHLKEVYDKFWQHQWLITDPARYQACTARRAIVENEQSKHGIDYAPIGTSHNDGKAFDISRGTVNALDQTLTQTGRTVSGLLRESPACNLGWGGNYSPANRDPVHFYTP